MSLASSFRGLPALADGFVAGRQTLAAIWARLVAGALQVTDAYEFEGRAYLALRACPMPSIRRRRAKTLSPVLLGQTRKGLAADLGIGASTLAQMLKLELAELGLSCSPARVPPALVLLAHAAAGFAPPLDTFVSHCTQAEVGHFVICTRVDAPRVRHLPEAVRSVLYLHAVGKSHADIAARRRTSPRTVANQVAFAFQRLGVSGRLDLLHEIFAGTRGTPLAADATSPANEY